jgi:aminopeptidase
VSGCVSSDERLQKFADLVVRVGANVQAGQHVVLIYLVEHTPIARAVARAALRAGARRVMPIIGDLHLRKAAIELGPE